MYECMHDTLESSILKIITRKMIIIMMRGESLLMHTHTHTHTHRFKYSNLHVIWGSKCIDPLGFYMCWVLSCRSTRTPKRLYLTSLSLIRSSTETLNCSCVSAGEEKPSTIPLTTDARQAITEHMATFHHCSSPEQQFIIVLMAEGRNVFSDISQLLLEEMDWLMP